MSWFGVRMRMDVSCEILFLNLQGWELIVYFFLRWCALLLSLQIKEESEKKPYPHALCLCKQLVVFAFVLVWSVEDVVFLCEGHFVVYIIFFFGKG